MAVLHPVAFSAQLALVVSLATIVYAYVGKYKASLTILGAIAIVFVLQLVGTSAEPILVNFTNGRDSELVRVDPILWELGLRPAEFLRGGQWWAPLTHMFVHGGFLHILGNAITLYFVGPKLEHHLGTRFVASLYFAAGIFAAAVSVGLLPGSEGPMVGASGAISGVLGLYALRFPRDQFFVPIGFFPVPVPAWLFLVFFIFYQFILSASGTNVAWWAHLAGLAVGLLVGAWMWTKERARRRGGHEPEAGAGWTVEYYGR